jgi:hypothetical protein
MLSLFVGCKEKVDFEKTEFSIVEKKNLEIMDLGRVIRLA